MVKETYRNRLNHIGQVWLLVCGLLNPNLLKDICYLGKRSNDIIYFQSQSPKVVFH